MLALKQLPKLPPSLDFFDETETCAQVRLAGNIYMYNIFLHKKDRVVNNKGILARNMHINLEKKKNLQFKVYINNIL